jgi:hypothetical protein
MSVFSNGRDMGWNGMESFFLFVWMDGWMEASAGGVSTFCLGLFFFSPPFLFFDTDEFVVLYVSICVTYSWASASVYIFIMCSITAIKTESVLCYNASCGLPYLWLFVFGLHYLLCLGPFGRA